MDKLEYGQAVGPIQGRLERQHDGLMQRAMTMMMTRSRQH